MLTPQRHQLILDLLRKQGVVKIQDLVAATDSSESTVRRDLIQLEKKHLLKRIHGGAALLQGKGSEPGMVEKSAKNLQEKKQIAAFAASLVKNGDCIYLDAGSTTFEMIPHFIDKQVTVVTNGVNHLEALVANHVKAYVLGGKMKASTKALIGSVALENLRRYRFDRCFLGANGIHPELGYTTPDPEEALLKQSAMQLSGQTYVLADHSKFSEISFAKFADLEEACLITDLVPEDTRECYEQKTSLFEVGKK
ncbi:DeoR/GlpR family DNA-binding transcription regulator [Lihuaxuella thermophila]|uniref:DeoR/GlpR family DNA-binding transcription regulator n=1 Tax=Lihuaxuella thermophila TaxID=1173111 RepID=UPI000B7EEB1E|nr:DeoR/GlpR family DNA-binding transcription regulator [Lihuaxuella thermophila]